MKINILGIKTTHACRANYNLFSSLYCELRQGQGRDRKWTFTELLHWILKIKWDTITMKENIQILTVVHLNSPFIISNFNFICLFSFRFSFLIFLSLLPMKDQNASDLNEQILWLHNTLTVGIFFLSKNYFKLQVVLEHSVDFLD